MKIIKKFDSPVVMHDMPFLFLYNRFSLYLVVNHLMFPRSWDSVATGKEVSGLWTVRWRNG